VKRAVIPTATVNVKALAAAAVVLLVMAPAAELATDAVQLVLPVVPVDVLVLALLLVLEAAVVAVKRDVNLVADPLVLEEPVLLKLIGERNLPLKFFFHLLKI
jgi:hypothetical protein